MDKDPLGIMLSLLPSAAETREREAAGRWAKRRRGRAAGGGNRCGRAGLRAPPRPPSSSALPAPGRARPAPLLEGQPRCGLCWGAEPLGVLGVPQGALRDGLG